MTEDQRLTNALKNKRWVAFIIVVAAIATGLSQFSDAIDKLLVAVHLRENALSLTKDGQRDDMSRQLTQIAWQRMSRAMSYLTRVKGCRSEAEQNDAWNRYIDSWNTNVMVFILGVERYYGHTKSLVFENDLLRSFNMLGDKMIAVRFQKLEDMCVSGKPTNASLLLIDNAAGMREQLNKQFYLFVSGFEQNNRNEIRQSPRSAPVPGSLELRETSKGEQRSQC
jgi:hypothetical protein